MLESSGRSSYQQMDAAAGVLIDQPRSVKEIVLLNHKTKEVYYGVDSLVRIIGHSFPLLHCLYRVTILRWLALKSYRLVSFNRKVVMPEAAEEGRFQPGFHAGYRLAYMLVALFVTAFVLHLYGRLLQNFIPSGSYLREILFCGGQFLWQGVLLRKQTTRTRWTYLGNMITVSLMGALLLLPVLGANILFPWQMLDILVAVYFGMVVGVMLLEHKRRIRILGLPAWLTFSWLLYRIFLLFFIF
ncbi:MAG TPA: hypothetical protein VHK69_05385 [Chitinophagaceae bacterium]|jgi:hypothetical protein|nr:hypothetical protein [Chitinophagaceae bacterium]